MNEKPFGHYVTFIPGDEKTKPDKTTSDSAPPRDYLWRTTTTSVVICYVFLQEDPLAWAINKGHAVVSIIPIENEERYSMLVDLLKEKPHAKFY